jgi:hypothetical protein
MKDEMRARLKTLIFMDRPDAENAVEKMAADATTATKKKMGLK